jgi:hypothetical protein
VRVFGLESFKHLDELLARGDILDFKSGGGVTGEESELFGGGGDGARDIFDWEEVGFGGEAFGELDEGLFEVGNGMGAISLANFGVKARDEADEVRIGVGSISGFLDRDAVEEGFEDMAVSERVLVE